MLHSAITILNAYVDGVKPHKFYSVQMERGKNIEDMYYLCAVGDNRYYVVFETDYILDTLTDVFNEAADIFKEYDVAPVGWVAKRGKSERVDVTNPDAHRDELVLKQDNSYLIHAVIEFKSIKNAPPRYSPTAYGAISWPFDNQAQTVPAPQ